MSGENQEFEIFCRYLRLTPFKNEHEAIILYHLNLCSNGIINAFRIFGYLPSEAYEELYRHCKVVLLRCNQHLINIGDPGKL